jgi:hypothetical protein
MFTMKHGCHVLYLFSFWIIVMVFFCFILSSPVDLWVGGRLSLSIYFMHSVNFCLFHSPLSNIWLCSSRHFISISCNLLPYLFVFLYLISLCYFMLFWGVEEEGGMRHERYPWMKWVPSIFKNRKLCMLW